MLTVATQRKFDKDFERVKKRGNDPEKLWGIVELLAAGKLLSTKNRNHKLVGMYDDCWECHIEPDWLLIYDKSSTTLTLMRTGTHSDLF